MKLVQPFHQQTGAGMQIENLEAFLVDRLPRLRKRMPDSSFYLAGSHALLEDARFEEELPSVGVEVSDGALECELERILTIQVLAGDCVRSSKIVESEIIEADWRLPCVCLSQLLVASVHTLRPLSKPLSTKRRIASERVIFPAAA